MQENAGNYQSLFLQARSMVVLLSVLLGAYVYRWAAGLYGPRCGLVALFLYALEPNIIAHSSLVTADLGGACFIFLTVFHFWRWRRTQSWAQLVACGLFSGLALLSKLSAVFLLPILGILLVADGWREFRGWSARSRWCVLAQTAAALFMTLLVLNAGYAFQGTLRPFGALTFKSGLMTAVQGVLPEAMPLPVPEAFALGLDHALRHDADLPEGSFYLLGELSSKGWWYYFIVAWLVKVPIPVLLLLPLAVLLRLCSPGRKGLRDDLFLVLPAAGFFVALSAASSLNIGLRHVLMTLPFVFVGVSQVGRFADAGRKWLGAALVLGGLWYAASAARICPDYLAYFNEFAGGPDGGRWVLVDSNLDWGQDLIQLKQYLDCRGTPEIRLGYFGRVDPRIYGIAYKPLGQERTLGLCVLSVTFLQGRPYVYPVPSEREPYRFAPANAFSWLREYEPVAKVGHTLFVYEIPRD
jgi:4-amino-4-deoxy-L-arabinose transferase-like glycosyltransferase